MNIKQSNRVFARAMYIMVIFALVFSVTGNASAQDEEPVPFIQAFAWFDGYYLVDWQPGVQVDVTIYDPFSSATYSGESFTPDALGWYGFLAGVDLQPGFVITATDGVDTKELDISTLSATVDASTGTVTGVATPNRTIHMKTDGDHFQWPVEQDIEVTSENGSWSATIDAYLPWEWFTRGEMWETDDDGDVTYAIWHVQQEIIEVWLAQNEIRAFGWPRDTELIFNVNGTDIGTAFTQPVDWYEGTWAVLNAGDYGVQLEPGMIVTVTGVDVPSKSTVIQDLKITGADIQNDLVHGYAPPNAVLELRSQEDSPVFRFFTAGEDGQWTVDYSIPSVNDVTVDVNSGDNFTLFMREDDKDSTVWDWILPTPSPWRDEFDGPLADGWYWINENPDKWEFNDGFLRIDASPYGTGDENLLLRPIAEGDFSIETRLIFSPDTNFQFAGLVIWQDAENFLQFGRAFCEYEGAPCVGNGIYFDYTGGSTNFATQIENPFDPAEAYLRLERRGEMVRAFYSHEGTTWTEIGTHWIPSDFQVTGVGLTSAQDFYSGSAIPARFDYFELTEGWGFLPEGFHDYDSGDVPTWACNAGGWAVDPDNRDADIAVEVNVDGTSYFVNAGEYREDLNYDGGCVDGSCGFFMPLWGIISSYETHNITAYGQDLESGEWVRLYNSPKELTCRTYDIYAYDPLTGETKQISNIRDADEYDPTWSPNGKLVAHDVVTSDSHQIYVTNVKTGVSTVLHGTEDGGNDAAWSPNGKWIAFDRRWFGEPNIYIVPATGGERLLVAENAFTASWAPSGKRIAFQSPDGSIRTAPVDGGKGGETLIAEFGGLPAWSPDGNWIAYSKDGDIWKVQVNVQGKVLGEPIQLTSNSFNDGKPTWTPDSQTIIYDSNFGQDSDLWSIPAAGGTPTWLTGAVVFGEYGPANARNSTNIAYAGFSPNGQAPRLWVAAYTYDPPVGTFDGGTHPYQFDFEWTVPEPGSWSGQGGEFVISDDSEIRDGYVLLRGPEELYGINYPHGFACEPAGNINPNQPTRFLIGWLAEPGDEITYSAAKAHFESITATAVWDGGSAELVRHEVIPFREGDWFNYVCTFTEAPPKMDLRVNYGHDWVESFYEGGHTVQIAVTESDGVTVKATAELVTEPKDFWGGETGFQTQWSDWNPGQPDIQPYDWVYAQVDNGATAKVQIGEINGTIDLAVDSVEGTVLTPWFPSDAEVNIECHPWGSPEPVEMKFDTALPNGEDKYSCTWKTDTGTEWDIQPGQDVGVGYFGPDGHWVANVISNPYVWAFPEANQVFGYGWPKGSPVTLTINGEEIATVNVEGAPWNENDVMARFDFGGTHDLITSDLVTLSGSGMERTHTVQNLAVTDINAEPDTVSGTADNDAVVHAWVHEFGHDVWPTVENGAWSAYFGSDDFHLQPGMCGRAEIPVEGRNSTNVDWCVPNPYVEAAPYSDWIHAREWPIGTVMTLQIDDPSDGLGDVDFTDTATMQQAPWNPYDPNDIVADFRWPDEFAPGPGYVLTMIGDNGQSKTLTISGLSVTGFDLDADTISGTGTEGTQIQVCANVPNRCITRWVTAAEGSGNWTADYGIPGTGGDDPDTFNVEPGSSGWAAEYEADSDRTWFDWWIPNPRIVASITEDWLYTQEFAPNTDLDVSIYESQGGTQIWTGTATTDGSGFVWVNAEGWNLEPGNYVVVFDGNTTKTLEIEGFTFDVFNLSYGQLTGTAPSGRNVWVGIGWQDQDAWTMNVTADNGTWLADFGQPVPSDYWWVAAQIFDADGDASELRPAKQSIFLRPRCGDTYTVQANIPLEIRYGSWLAHGEDLAIQNAEHLTVDLMLDGELVTSGVQQPVVPGSEIPCGASAGAYGVFYITQVEPLGAGTHIASVTWIFDEQVTDGGDVDGDGVPDLYGPGVVSTYEFTIIVP